MQKSSNKQSSSNLPTIFKAKPHIIYRLNKYYNLRTQMEIENTTPTTNANSNDLQPAYPKFLTKSKLKILEARLFWNRNSSKLKNIENIMQDYYRQRKYQFSKDGSSLGGEHEESGTKNNKHRRSDTQKQLNCYDGKKRRSKAGPMKKLHTHEIQLIQAHQKQIADKLSLPKILNVSPKDESLKPLKINKIRFSSHHASQNKKLPQQAKQKAKSKIQKNQKKKPIHIKNPLPPRESRRASKMSQIGLPPKKPSLERNSLLDGAIDHFKKRCQKQVPSFELKLEEQKQKANRWQVSQTSSASNPREEEDSLKKSSASRFYFELKKDEGVGYNSIPEKFLRYVKKK